MDGLKFTLSFHTFPACVAVFFSLELHGWGCPGNILTQEQHPDECKSCLWPTSTKWHSKYLTPCWRSPPWQFWPLNGTFNPVSGNNFAQAGHKRPTPHSMIYYRRKIIRPMGRPLRRFVNYFHNFQNILLANSGCRKKSIKIWKYVAQMVKS